MDLRTFLCLKMSWDSFQVNSLGKLDSKLFLVERSRQPFFILFRAILILQFVFSCVCNCNSYCKNIWLQWDFFHYTWLIDFLHFHSIWKKLYHTILYNSYCKTVIVSNCIFKNFISSKGPKIILRLPISSDILKFLPYRPPINSLNIYG